MNRLIAFRLLPPTNYLLAHWPLAGHFNDISPARIGPAVPAGTNVTLHRQIVSIRVPGYLNLPAVDIEDRSFSVAFTLRIPSGGTGGRRFLYADWSFRQWKFVSSIEESNVISVKLRRNIETDGSNPEQDLVMVNEWFEVVWTFDRTERALTLYLDGRRTASATVRPSVEDLTLKRSNRRSYQFGRKNDQGTNLDADLKNRRIYATSSIALTRI